MMSENIAVSVLLIDGENIPARHAEKIMALLGGDRLAEARVYGDFSNPAMQGWRDCAAQYGLRLCQTAGRPGGKNSADMLLTIDAMDLLWVPEYQGFCIVSGDHDFVPLAVRLRRAGKTVTGIGTDKANMVFRNACHVFHVLTVDAPLLAVIAAPPLVPCDALIVPRPAVTPPAKKRDLMTMLQEIRGDLKSDAQGWMESGPMGQAIRKRYPGIVWSAFGGKTLTKAFAADPRFEAKAGGYIRLKESAGGGSGLRVVKA